MSFLPYLSAFFSVAFGLNLAYLALPAFRYRDIISGRASRAIDKISCAIEENGKETIKTTIENNSHFPSLKWLARMKEAHADSAKTKRPDGFWSVLYSWLFAKHIDTFFSGLIVLLSGSFIALGSAHASGQFLDFMPNVTNGDTAFYWVFFLTLFACILPLLLVFGGRWITRHACYYIDRETKNLCNFAYEYEKEEKRAKEIWEIAKISKAPSS